MYTSSMLQGAKSYHNITPRNSARTTTRFLEAAKMLLILVLNLRFLPFGTLKKYTFRLQFFEDFGSQAL